MMPTFKHRLLVFLWNLVNAFVSGMASSGAAAGGGHLIGAMSFTWRQLVAVGVSGGAISAVNYLRTNRLPTIDE